MIPDYEQRLDDLFVEAFDTNHPAMHDWVLVKMELRKLRINQLKEIKPTTIQGRDCSEVIMDEGYQPINKKFQQTPRNTGDTG